MIDKQIEALKSIGVTEVILAISYQPQVSENQANLDIGDFIFLNHARILTVL